MTLLSKILDRLFSLLPRCKPKQTCRTMLLWQMPHEKAEKVIEALLANSTGDDWPEAGEHHEQPGDYLELPDGIRMR